MSSAFLSYLEDLHRIRASGLASDERSYYPPLAALLRACGERLTAASGATSRRRPPARPARTS